MGKTYVHIVWSPQMGPMYGYLNPELAFTHARTMLGVDVTSIAISHQLPDTLREDLSEEFEGDDDTPLAPTPVKPEDDMAIDVAVAVQLDELDDKDKAPLSGCRPGSADEI